MNQATQIEVTQTFLRLEAIFHEAVDLPPSERPALITHRCAGDRALIAEINALLAASDQEEQASSSNRSEAQHPASTARQRVGPYQIDRLLGRGGMGAVYLAHRADGQFEQQLAIKLIDLPLATDFFRERFRQERQILAGLQHPFIARLLDGGVTPAGDLYLAMEYVDGIPIHRYCDEKKLTLNQRLALFRQVCEAVQFAHQNLVVHRDLKPDNILVAADGTPRLLDFGTAKLVSPSLDNQEGDLTRHGYQSFTPQYASPEQILGNPITTASDTYSLGVLLYLLLTGAPPYEIKELSLTELVRIICNEPPRRPTHTFEARTQPTGGPASTPRRTHPSGSAAASTGPASGDSSSHSNASHPAANPPQRTGPARNRLDPDLEAILQKALRKEPLNRYRTAEQLSADIGDYLAGRPVPARRGSFQYRAAKFVRRNRLAIAAATLLFATLMAGLAGVLWQARLANQQRRRAEARSSDLRQLSTSLLSELDEAIKQLPGSTGVQKLLVTRVLEHLDRMAADAQAGHDLDRPTQLDLVDAYSSLASLQGDPYFQNLGDPAGAISSVGKALSLAQPLATTLPAGALKSAEDRRTLEALAHAQVTRSEILFGTGQTHDAVASMQAAAQSYERLIADPAAPIALIGEVAAVYGALGDELGQSGTASLGDANAALTAYRRTIDLDHRALQLDPTFLRAQRGLALMQMKIGSVELDTDPAQALKDFRLADRLLSALPEKEKSTLSGVRMRIMIERKQANALEAIGSYPESIALYEKLRVEYQKFSDQDPLDRRALDDLKVILDDEAGTWDDAGGQTLAPAGQGSPADRAKAQLAAFHLYSQTAAVLERIARLGTSNENDRVQLAFTRLKAADLGQQLNQPGDWASQSKKELETLKELARHPDASPLALDYALEAALEVLPKSLRDPAFALDCAQRRAAMSQRRSASGLISLAQAYRAIGQTDQARQAAHEGLALLPAWHAGQPKSRSRRLLEDQLQ